MGMRKILSMTLAAVTILAGAMLADRAAAMTPATPSALGVAAAPAAMVRQAHVVCATNGCAPVQVSRVKKPKKLPGAR
jgi:hypothetical protein